MNPEDAQSFYKAAIETSLSFYDRRTRVELVDEPQTQVIRNRIAPTPTRNESLSSPGPSIFLGSLGYNVEEEEIRELFAPFGTITRIKIGMFHCISIPAFSFIAYPLHSRVSGWSQTWICSHRF